jgi:hypothetical protein
LRGDEALGRLTDGDWRTFAFETDLRVFDDGTGNSCCTGCADGRDRRSFPLGGGEAFMAFRRFELWAL